MIRSILHSFCWRSPPVVMLEMTLASGDSTHGIFTLHFNGGERTNDLSSLLHRPHDRPPQGRTPFVVCHPADEHYPPHLPLLLAEVWVPINDDCVLEINSVGRNHEIATDMGTNFMTP